MRNSYFLMLSLLCLFVVSIHAQVPSDLRPMNFSLIEARDYALTNSPVLLNSARDVEIAKNKIWETTAMGLPQASINSSYSYSPQLAGLSDQLGEFIPDFNPDDLKTSFFMGAQIDQLVFSGPYIIGLQAAKTYAYLSVLAESKSKIGIIENITNTYFTALIARESKNILDSTLVAAQKTLFESEQMFKNGFVESTDVDQIRILESNIRSSLSVAERQIGIVERMLKFQMGVPIDQSIVLTDQIDPLIGLMNLEVAVIDSFRLENNVDYRLMDLQEKLKEYNLKYSKSMYLPTVRGFYSYYKSLDDNFFNDQSPNTYGLSLSFPIFSSGQRISQVSQRKLEYMKSQTDKETGAESLLLQYESALSIFLSAQDIYNLQKVNRDLSLKIYKKSNTKFREGIGSSLDLNTTQQQYFDSESKYFSALMSLVAAKSKLESLLSDQ